MTNAPEELTKDLDRSFADRVLEPLQQRALGLGRRLSGADTADRIRRKLDLAGNPPGWTVDRVVSGEGPRRRRRPRLRDRVRADVRGLRHSGSSWPSAGSSVGFFGPNLYLYQKVHERSEQLQRELPDAIDLLTISVESGLGFDAAVQQVARNTEGPLSEEFSRMLREMQIGQGRADALRGTRRAHQRARHAQFRGRHGPGRLVRYPGRAGAACAVLRDAGQASSAGRGEGAAGAGQDHHPADLLHPARPSSSRSWAPRSSASWTASAGK